MRGIEASLRTMLASGVAALGFELVDAELTGSTRRPTLRVYIDGPRGVTVGDCADVSRQLSAILDVENPLPGTYILEVSSPGLDRPLVDLKDFRRFSGETVKVKLHQALAGRRNFKGRLEGVSGEHVVLELNGMDGGNKERIELDFSNIERAKLVPNIRRAPQ